MLVTVTDDVEGGVPVNVIVAVTVTVSEELCDVVDEMVAVRVSVRDVDFVPD